MIQKAAWDESIIGWHEQERMNQPSSFCIGTTPMVVWYHHTTVQVVDSFM